MSIILDQFVLKQMDMIIQPTPFQFYSRNYLTVYLGNKIERQRRQITARMQQCIGMNSSELLSISCSPRNFMMTSQTVQELSYRQTNRQTHRQTDTDPQTDTQADPQTDKQTDTQTHRQTHRPTDRHTDTQTDTHTDRQTHNVTKKRTEIGILHFCATVSLKH